MIAFIDDHREAYGVEPICKVLPIAPSTYRANVVQRIDPSKRSAGAAPAGGRDGPREVWAERATGLPDRRATAGNAAIRSNAQARRR